MSEAKSVESFCRRVENVWTWGEYPACQCHNEAMADKPKQDSKTAEVKKAPRPLPVSRKIGEAPGNLRKREEWFEKRSNA